MICKNCSAEIREDELLCPYCGTENFKIAKEQQELYVSQLQIKTEKIKELPRKFIKKVSKFLIYLVPVLLGSLAIFAIVVHAFSKVMQGDVLAQEEEQIAILEEYYDTGDYEQMCEYYESLDNHISKQGGSYGKYERVSELYKRMKSDIEMLESRGIWEGVGAREHYAERLEDCIGDCVEQLKKIADMEEVDFVYDEEEGALYIRKQYIDALQKYAYLTKDEITSAVLTYDEDGSDYDELTEIAMQRMEEEIQ